MTGLEQDRQVVETRLTDPQIRGQLAELVILYYRDHKEALTLAEVATNGRRPEGLTNEIYACFHHLARGLVEGDCDPLHELGDKSQSHLKRLGLDSLKLYINSVLKDSEPVLQALDLLSGHPRLRSIVDGGEGTLDATLLCRNELRKCYLAAKQSENWGRTDVMAKYQAATQRAMELSTLLSKISSSRRLTLLLEEHEEERMRQRRSEQRSKYAIYISIAAVLASSGIFVVHLIGMIKS